MELQPSLPLEDERIFSVTEINEAARDAIEGAFPSVRVEGEISGYRLYPSGHHYFDLKDDSSRISCAFFAGRARGLRFELENGIQVVCTGKLSIYGREGRFQMIIERVEMGGLGPLWQKLEALKKKLQDEGLLDEKRKKPLPPFPRKVGIVTSPEGQAIHDILKILLKRAPQIAVLIYPVHVQGEGAAAEIAEGVRWMDADGRCDVLITGRGGGSIEDLWAFNEEIVARAIAGCRLPIISAVGHEKDVLLSDLVADARAPTPSGAAEMLAKSREEIQERLAKIRLDMRGKIAEKISTARERLAILNAQPGFRRIEGNLYQMMQRVDSLRGMVIESIRKSIEQKRSRIADARLGIEHCSPVAILQKRQEMVRSLRTQLPLLVGKYIEAKLLHLRNLHGLLLARLPLPAIADRRQRIARAREILQALVAALVEGRRDRISKNASVLNALGPFQVLDRGYSICFKEGTTIVVSDAAAIQESERLSIRLRRGRIGADVTSRQLE